MKTTNEKLTLLSKKIEQGNVKIMIMGLGSVGLYLLDYIMGKGDPNISLVVVGRNFEKLNSDVNIIRIANLIKNQNKSDIKIEGNCDFTDVEAIKECVSKHKPDFIFNTSRLCGPLGSPRFDSITWKTTRCYSIWSPLAASLIRNIMNACEKIDSSAIVINASFPDAVIAWLKSANMPYPDFGSGNLNHLIPRIQFAVAEINSISDFWNVEVTLATSHYHNAVISREGHAEGEDPLIHINYQGETLNVNKEKIYAMCKIPMPNDNKRDMMSGASNYHAVFSIIDALKNNDKRVFHSPGFSGLLGGYPVVIDGNSKMCYIDESKFCIEDMIAHNNKSMYLEGIESIENGVLTFSDTLVKRFKSAFFVDIPKHVSFEDIDNVTNLIVENIIGKVVSKGD